MKALYSAHYLVRFSIIIFLVSSIFIVAAGTVIASGKGCKIESNYHLPELGGVATYGSLKIRVNGYNGENDCYPLGCVDIDIKAPGFQKSLRLHKNKPVQFVICGSEVTITYRGVDHSVGGYDIQVAVF